MTNVKYIAVDIESTNLTPVSGSMIAIGACEVCNTKNTFYTELKPTNQGYALVAMEIGSLGLECLRDLRKTDKRYDPKNKSFEPD